MERGDSANSQTNSGVAVGYTHQHEYTLETPLPESIETSHTTAFGAVQPYSERPKLQDGTTMITNLELTNFKAFKELDIQLRPVTLLFGPNNAGKSSVLAPIRLLVQTMDSRDIDVSLLLNGALGDFGAYGDVVFGNHRGRPFSIALTVTKREGPPHLSSDKPIRLALEYKHRTQRRETILREASFEEGDRDVVTFGYSRSSERHLLQSLRGVDVPSALKAPLAEHLNVRHFLPYVYGLSRRSEGEGKGKVEEFLRQFEGGDFRRTSSISRILYSVFNSVDYVGAMRTPPKRTYLFTGERRRRVGPSGEHAASLFMLNTMRRGEEDGKFHEKTSEWFQRAGIGDEISVDAISDRHYELEVTHPITGETENISDVGYGNSQVFPVIVGGYRLDEGSTFIVEEPEIHLHPRAQAELGSFVLDLYRDRVQSLVETHSEYLMLRLQQHIAAGELPANDVAVYYVHADPDRGKRVRRIKLDEKGRFTDEWPEGFFPERLEEAKTLSKLRSKSR